MVRKTGRVLVGEVVGKDAQLVSDKSGFRKFAVRLPVDAAARLLALLSQPEDGASRHGFIYTATQEKLNRLRLLRDPPPLYELRAARHYLRSDVVRVSGTQRSCNIYVAPQGVAAVSALLGAAIADAQEWLEMRVRVVHRRGGQRCVLEFVPDTEIKARLEERRLGEAGAALAAEVWTEESFRDWE
jgi:hypothetical protein